MNRWLVAARPLAHANIAPPLVFGQCLAYAIEGDFDPAIAAAVHLFGVFDHLYIVFANDAADWEADVANTTFNRFSGGSRVVPDGLLTPRQLALAAMLAVAGMTLVSLYLVFSQWRIFTVVVCSLAVGLLWAYSFPPLRLSYRGRGEWAQGLGVGVVLPLLGYHAQSARVLGIPAVAIAGGLVLGWAGNLVTALPDTPSDARAKKRTFSVRRGEATTRRAALGAIALAAVVVPAYSGASLRAAVTAAVAPLVLLALAVPLLGTADSDRRASCERFVFLLGGAITAAWLSWSLLWLGLGP